jgi:hypothetical protein
MKTEPRKYNEDGSAEYDQGVIVCDCNYFDHSIIYWKQEYPLRSEPDVMEREVYLGVSLCSYDNFWTRLKSAFKYLFKKERFGMYGEILISRDNISGLKDIVDFINNEEDDI